MILIADSGSTKTHWYWKDENRTEHLVSTSGINPFLLTEEEMERILRQELLSQVPEDTRFEQIFFYGAGCTPEKSVVVKACLQRCFPPSTQLEVTSDLVGAARSLCQHEAGIACILGTGSNSCAYNGKEITQNVSPLGYMLGDEGSGAVLGRTLLGDCLKKQLPEAIVQDFFDTYALTPAQILEKVYRTPMPNRFMASLTPFLTKHRKAPEIHRLLTEQFARFFQRNVMQYAYTELPIHLTGSIAWYFQSEVTEAAQALGLPLSSFLQSPIDGLKRYHEEGEDVSKLK